MRNSETHYYWDLLLGENNLGCLKDHTLALKEGFLSIIKRSRPPSKLWIRCHALHRRDCFALFPSLLWLQPAVSAPPPQFWSLQVLAPRAFYSDNNQCQERQLRANGVIASESQILKQDRMWRKATVFDMAVTVHHHLSVPPHLCL